MRIRKKQLLARALHSIGAPSIARSIRRFCGHEIMVLAYHRVQDLLDEDTFLFDPELVSASVTDFAWQMSYVSQKYNPITFTRLLDAIDGKSSLPPRPVIVTFDDGFHDNYRYAFPVLRSIGVPATFFVSTGYIGQTHTFWFDWLVYLCKYAGSVGVPLRIGDQVFPFSARDNATLIYQAMLAIRALSDSERKMVIRIFEGTLSMQYPADGFDESRPMTWEQAREMANAGMEFGSHTVSHPVLTSLGDDELQQELSVSKQTLEAQLGLSIDVLAYPMGLFDDRVRRQAQEVGYRMGIAYESGVNRFNTLDRFGIMRLHVERYVDRHEFAMSLALPEIFS